MTGLAAALLGLALDLVRLADVRPEHLPDADHRLGRLTPTLRSGHGLQGRHGARTKVNEPILAVLRVAKDDALMHEVNVTPVEPEGFTDAGTGRVCFRQHAHPGQHRRNMAPRTLSARGHVKWEGLRG